MNNKYIFLVLGFVFVLVAAVCCDMLYDVALQQSLLRANSME